MSNLSSVEVELAFIALILGIIAFKVIDIKEIMDKNEKPD